MSRVPDVLLRMTDPLGPTPAWSRRDGRALYESRALTELICQKLALREYLDETLKDGRSVFRVNEKGHKAAGKLRRDLDSFGPPTGR